MSPDVKYVHHSAFLLATLGRRAESSWTAFLREKNINTSEYTALSVLTEAVANQRTVAARMGIDERNAGAIMSRLIARGWVETLPNPKDRRAKLLSLTPAGARWWSEVEQELQIGRTTFFQVLSPLEQKCLEELLRKLNDSHIQ